jgi:hypothetical protein
MSENTENRFSTLSFIFQSTPIRLGISISLLISIIFGFVYLAVLHEPGSAFYPFAGLVFLGGPLLGGISVVMRTQAQRIKAFFASSTAIFVIVLLLFFVVYAILPQFDRTSVQLPAFCDGFDGNLNPPANLLYTLPDGNTGILLTSDAHSAVIATIDSNHSPFSSTLFLINKDNNQILQSLRFSNDVISAALDEDTVYIYNDKLGYLIEARTGEFEQNFLLIDNYGGLSETDRPIISRASSGHWYMETTAVISSWHVDGTVKSRPHLTFNSIALGCFISGDTHEVTQL